MSRTGKPSSHSSPPGVKRLGQELQEMLKNPPPLCSAGLKANDLYEWTAVILGPPGTVYEGGTFALSLKFPMLYPFQPPVVRFTTKIYHCNVGLNGGICMDVLGASWSPAITVAALLLSICSLLTDANPHSPLRADIAFLYRTNRPQHDIKARAATARHAMRK